MSLTLKYWPGRGLMEVNRMMLAIAGKFPSEGAYVDERCTSPPANLEQNLGRMPLLVTESGETVGECAPPFDKLFDFVKNSLELFLNKITTSYSLFLQANLAPLATTSRRKMACSASRRLRRRASCRSARH